MFPADCRCCEAPLLRAGSLPVCDECLRGLAAASQTGVYACGICGEALGLDLDLEDERFASQMAEALLCRECRMAAPAFDKALSYGTYQGELRTLIGLLKFDGVTSVAAVLSERLAHVMLRLEPSPMLVVAVPLFKARERQRGFNQSVMLTDKVLVKVRKLRPEWKLTASHNSLQRMRSTESQYVLSRKGRRRNLRGAFAVTGDVAGREVMVVDDIMTSGATARECARVLKVAGAAKVWVVTLARAQKVEFARAREDPAEAVARWN